MLCIEILTHEKESSLSLKLYLKVQSQHPAQLYLFPQGDILEGAPSVETHQSRTRLQDPHKQWVLQQRVEEDSAALLRHHPVHAVEVPSVMVHVMEVNHAGARHMVVGQLSH